MARPWLAVTPEAETAGMAKETTSPGTAKVSLNPLNSISGFNSISGSNIQWNRRFYQLDQLDLIHGLRSRRLKARRCRR